MSNSRVESYAVPITERDLFLWLLPQLAGDEQLYEAYAARVMRDLKCYFAGRRCQAAEDLTAEVLLRLTRKLESAEALNCDSEEARRRYMFGIARHVLHEWKRRPDVRETGFLNDGDRHFNLPSVDLVAEECLKILTEVVQANLKQLGPMEQDTLVKSLLDTEYAPTLAELAKRLGIQAPAMRKRVSRARDKFRELVLASDRLADLFRCLEIPQGAK